MASKIATARAALFGAIDAVSGVRGYRYEVDKPEPLGAIVQFPTSVERFDQPGKWVLTIPVLVFAQRSSDRTADATLEAKVDAIIDAIEGDPNLDGTIDYAVFVGADGYNLLQIGEVSYLAVTLRFEVVA